MAYARCWLYRRLNDGKAHNARRVLREAQLWGIQPATLLRARDYLDIVQRDSASSQQGHKPIRVWYLKRSTEHLARPSYQVADFIGHPRQGPHKSR
jgi:hypothetical protein